MMRTTGLPSRQAFLVAMVLAMTCPAIAQQANEGSVDAIVGSEVREEETSVAARQEAVIAAIEQTEQSIAAVRKAAKLEQIEIVFLADSARSEGGPPPVIEGKLQQHTEAIATLRDEIEGNAMLYHAIDSRRVLVDDVVAVTFEGGQKAVIYAATKPAGG